MTLLITGLVLWCGLHFLPSFGTALRVWLIEQFGEEAYRLLFSAGIVISIVLMILGWMSTPSGVPLYSLPDGMRIAAIVLMAASFIMFTAARTQSNIRHFIRHPQLTGIAVWAAAHLLVNGDKRAVILFGTLGIWAIVEIIAINRREGDWNRPTRQPFSEDIKPALIGLILFAVLMALHPFLFGVSPFPTHKGAQ